MKITKVYPHGIGRELGIKAGDRLAAFDGRPVVDILDYGFYDVQNDFVMTVETDGEIIDFEISKDDGETLGLEFGEELPPIRCRNKCIFCFVDQLPPVCRPSLKVKDDDYRMSFLTGSYITLSNLGESEFERILRLRLSPLYISVHSTDDNVRRRVMGNKGGGASAGITEQMRRLHNGGIKLHTQIVYCHGYNDDYVKSARELSEVAASLAVVPVGLTKYCNKALTPVDRDIARKVIADTEPLQAEFLAERGDRFVYLADEFYLKAGLAVPPFEEYGEFEQIENGVGLLAKLEREAEEYLETTNDERRTTNEGREITVATSVAAYDTIKRIVELITGNRQPSTTVTVVPIVNDYFGHSVTVAGLITGGDLAAQLAGKVRGRLLIPRCMLKEGGDLFLDGMTVAELGRRLGVMVEVVGAGGEELVRAIQI